MRIANEYLFSFLSSFFSSACSKLRRPFAGGLLTLATRSASRETMVSDLRRHRVAAGSPITLQALLRALVPLLPRPKAVALCRLACSMLRQELRLTKEDFQLVVRRVLGEDLAVLQSVMATFRMQQRRACMRVRSASLKGATNLGVRRVGTVEYRATADGVWTRSRQHQTIGQCHSAEHTIGRSARRVHGGAGTCGAHDAYERS